MARLEDDDEAERQGHTLWKDLIPIVRLLVAPYIPIMEYARKSGPNGTANGLFLSLAVTFWCWMSIFFFCAAILDDGTGEVSACCGLLCSVVAAIWFFAILIANEVTQEGSNVWSTSGEFNILLQGMWCCFSLFVRILFTPYIRILNQEIWGVLGMAYYAAMCLCLTLFYVGCPFFFVRALLDLPFNGLRWDYWWLSCRCYFASSALYCLVLATTGRPGRLLRRYFTAVVRFLLTPYSFLIAEAGESGIALTVHAIFVCVLVTCFLLQSAWFFYLALLDPCLDNANRIGFWLASVVSLLVAACMYLLTLATAIGSTIGDWHQEKLLVASLLGRLGIKPRASSPERCPSETMGTASQPSPPGDPLASAHDDQFPRG
ncbi:hypothetical protein CEP54_011090 [Fusarium duplospermum]|uniref:Uncharacterized protein n=1 Tax=Fusarium duplospermum TaxID=1325734 RepID=A0A428PGC8_9HYPO|nr:hypothetical protein CEP54_011090 [Fusarium duplospermum]